MPRPGRAIGPFPGLSVVLAITCVARQGLRPWLCRPLSSAGTRGVPRTRRARWQGRSIQLARLATKAQPGRPGQLSAGDGKANLWRLRAGPDLLPASTHMVSVIGSADSHRGCIADHPAPYLHPVRNPCLRPLTAKPCPGTKADFATADFSPGLVRALMGQQMPPTQPRQRVQVAHAEQHAGCRAEPWYCSSTVRLRPSARMTLGRLPMPGLARRVSLAWRECGFLSRQRAGQQ